MNANYRVAAIRDAKIASTVDLAKDSLWIALYATTGKRGVKMNLPEIPDSCTIRLHSAKIVYMAGCSVKFVYK